MFNSQIYLKPLKIRNVNSISGFCNGFNSGHPQRSQTSQHEKLLVSYHIRAVYGITNDNEKIFSRPWSC